MRVLYLTWGEDLATSGILENQVINQLIVTKRHHADLEYTYLCAMPIFWKRHHKSANSILEEKKQRLKAAGIRLKIFYYWLPVRARYIAIVAHRLFAPIFYIWFRKIARICTKENIHAIHARAYTGTVVAAATKRFANIKVPLIFDTRGLYVNELLQLKFIKENSFWHSLWRNAEKLAYEMSAVVVNVSAPFSNYVSRKFLLGTDKVKTLHTSVNIQVFKPATQRTAERQKRFKSKAVRLVYCGDLGGSSWHRTDSLFAVYNIIRKSLTGATLTIISPANESSIRSEIFSSFPNADELLADTRFLRTFNAAETAKHLAEADLGLFTYHELLPGSEQYLSDIVLGSKTGEYLAAGLPIIVNRSAKAAAELVIAHKVGMVYDVHSPVQFTRDLKKILADWQGYSRRARKTAETLFSADSNAQQYYRIYRQLTKFDSETY